MNTSGFSTAGITGTPYFEFDLVGDAGNTVTLSNLNLGSGSLVSGSVPLSLTSSSSNSTGIVTGYWQFVPGAVASFTLTSTDIAPSTAALGPDTLFIRLDDPTQTPYTTTDTTDDSLLTLFLTGGADTPELFVGTEAPILGLGLTESSTTGPGVVPEPTPLGFVVLGLGLAAFIIPGRKYFSLLSHRHSMHTQN